MPPKRSPIRLARSARAPDPDLFLPSRTRALRRAERDTGAHRLLLNRGGRAAELFCDPGRGSAHLGERSQRLELTRTPGSAVVRRSPPSSSLGLRPVSHISTFYLSVRVGSDIIPRINWNQHAMVRSGVFPHGPVARPIRRAGMSVAAIGIAPTAPPRAPCRVRLTGGRYVHVRVRGWIAADFPALHAQSLGLRERRRSADLSVWFLQEQGRRAAGWDPVPPRHSTLKYASERSQSRSSVSANRRVAQGGPVSGSNWPRIGSLVWLGRGACTSDHR